MAAQQLATITRMRWRFSCTREYLTAYLVLDTLGIKPNPDNPYNNFKNQQPFGTFGGPDITELWCSCSCGASTQFGTRSGLSTFVIAPNPVAGLFTL